MVAFLVIVVIALAVVLLTRIRADRTVPEPAPSAVEQEPPFRVVTLGTRMAGKTLFLASMFHELQVSRGRNYWITADHGQTITLNAWFAELEDRAEEFPRGTATGDTRTFTFNVMTRTPSNRAVRVLSFDYLEYAGGLLTDSQAVNSAVQTEVLRKVSEAQALICLLDGEQIRRMLDGDRDGSRAVRTAIRAVAKHLQEADCPVTFVVTKWDLLRDIDLDDDQRLALIGKRLRYEPAFDELVRQHSVGRIVRLVPVSALGDDFVDYHAGQVTKRRDGTLSPTNVDVPLAAVVPDIFEQLEHHLEARQLQTEFHRLRAMTRLGPAASAAELAGFLGRAATGAWAWVGQARFAAPTFISDATAELFSSGPAQERDQNKIDTELARAEHDLREFRIARRQVLRELRRRVDVLEGRLPSSRLRGD
jgi:hypothetical protein